MIEICGGYIKDTFEDEVYRETRQWTIGGKKLIGQIIYQKEDMEE